MNSGLAGVIGTAGMALCSIAPPSFASASHSDVAVIAAATKAANSNKINIHVFLDSTSRSPEPVWVQRFQGAAHSVPMVNALAAGNLLQTLQGPEMKNTALPLAQSMLADLHKAVEEAFLVFAADTDYPEEYLRANSLTDSIAKLREAEHVVATRLTQQQDEEHLALRRSLAQTRSLAVRAQKMIDQRLITPEVFDGRASQAGLKALADMATERLQNMAG